ncbi:hypothetical protein [Cryobacterium aureum]|nr:hypothetical protein [Cryobacterium aureum]
MTGLIATAFDHFVVAADEESIAMIFMQGAGIDASQPKACETSGD